MEAVNDQVITTPLVCRHFVGTDGRRDLDVALAF
jgi:hypothetical protein